MPNSFGSLVSEVAKNHIPSDPLQPHGLIVSSYVHEHIPPNPVEPPPPTVTSEPAPGDAVEATVASSDWVL